MEAHDYSRMLSIRCGIMEAAQSDHKSFEAEQSFRYDGEGRRSGAGSLYKYRRSGAGSLYKYRRSGAGSLYKYQRSGAGSPYKYQRSGAGSLYQIPTERCGIALQIPTERCGIALQIPKWIPIGLCTMENTDGAVRDRFTNTTWIPIGLCTMERDDSGGGSLYKYPHDGSTCVR
jgi:hypothetical protein